MIAEIAEGCSVKRWATAVLALAVLVIGCVGYAAWSRTPPWGRPEPAAVAGAEGDYLVLGTLEELAQQAELIAVGTVQGVAGTRNLARDPWDPEKPHPSLEITGVDYQFAVEEILKGSAPDTFLVTEASSLASRGGEPAEFRGFKEMPSGGRYVLFLRAVTDGSGNWIGVAEPWRFALRDGQVIVESKWEYASERFPVTAEDGFMAQVRTAAGGP